MIYIVQDIQGNICGVFSTLKAAAPMFESVYAEGIKMLKETGVEIEYEEDPFFDCDMVPEIQAWRVDGEIDEVFFHPDDVKEGLEE
jgi:hypothetical protein